MELTPEYVTGFIDGEGSFLVSFSRRSKLSVGIEARPSFSVSQHRRNRLILEALQHFFHCGGIRFDRHDQTYKYEVRSLSDLTQKIIPHFEQYSLKTSKASDFEALKEICALMRANHHRSSDGMRRIIERAYKMNNLGARRYQQEELLRMMQEMKV